LESLISISGEAHQTGTVAFDGPLLSTGATYQNCQRVTLVLRASTGFLIADEDITAGLDCSGQCGFYSNSTCSASITQATIPAGSYSSPDFFVMPTAASLTLATPGDAPYYTGSSITGIPVNVAYSGIDAQYVWSASNLYSIGSYIEPNTIQAGDAWVCESRDGYRGKIRINSVSSVHVTGDTLNFDFVLWDSAYNVINSSAGETITAGFPPDYCYIDLDKTPVVINTGTSIDVWWENLSGNLYFNPQASAIFRLLP
jgi:hypothetical protein